MVDVKIDWVDGNCPVQGEGTIDGKKFYFRARGTAWSLSIGGDPVGDPEWSYGQLYGDNIYAAGWMTEDEARAFIIEAANLYEEQKK